MAGYSSHLHYPLLDLQHYTNDSLDPVLGGMAWSINLLNLGIIDRPIEWLFIFRFRRRTGLRAPLYPLHGRSHIQFDDAD